MSGKRVSEQKIPNLLLEPKFGKSNFGRKGRKNRREKRGSETIKAEPNRVSRVQNTPARDEMR